MLGWRVSVTETECPGIIRGDEGCQVTDADHADSHRNPKGAPMPATTTGDRSGVPPHPGREAAVSIVRQLRARGRVAYLAGGCVRDELLGLVPKDYDVATDASPDEVRRLFRRSGLVGAAFGVVLVRQSGVAVEVATFREDGPYSDQRRPDRGVCSTPEADARRRDFTINALFRDPLAEGGDGIIDHVGGVADLRAGVIRAVGDASARLAEDHLRGLRAVRFAARLGFEIEPVTRGAIAADAAALRGVSPERIGEEMRRMLGHPSRGRAVGRSARTRRVRSWGCGRLGGLGVGALPQQ